MKRRRVWRRSSWSCEKEEECPHERCGLGDGGTFQAFETVSQKTTKQEAGTEGHVMAKVYGTEDEKAFGPILSFTQQDQIHAIHVPVLKSDRE